MEECGGCKGIGAHKRLCRKTNPHWYRMMLAQQANDLADEIGSNDPGSANLAYLIASRLNSGETWGKGGIE